MNEFLNLKNYLDSLVTKHLVPGVDCVVYQNHEIVFRYYTGMSDLENQRKMQGDELYLIFSMTKMLTCVSALQLYEQGKYLLDDPVSMYLPEFEKMRISDMDFDVKTSSKIATGASTGAEVTVQENGYAKNPITIRHLFTMSAGLDYNLNSDAIMNAKKNGKKSTRELISAIAETVLGFEPGTRFRYSLCHDVLGALIEIWSGQKLGDYMDEHIFKPLGMKNTFFGLPSDNEKMSKMAARYIYDENKLPKRLDIVCGYNLTEEYQSGGAGLTSCLEDYALFLDAMACGGVGRNGKKILSPATIELMKMNQLNEVQLKDFLIRSGYGYGLGVRTHMDKIKSGSLSPIGEFGWDGAAGAFAMVDTTNRISLTYFQHIHNWDIRIQTALTNALYSDISRN